MKIMVLNNDYSLPSAYHIKKIFDFLCLGISDSDFYELTQSFPEEIKKLKNVLNFEFTIFVNAVNIEFDKEAIYKIEFVRTGDNYYIFLSTDLYVMDGALIYCKIINEKEVLVWK